MGVAAISTLSTVETAVRNAASATGVDFDFLMRTAKRESGYNPLAHASTSSAAGLFQFVEQTWLRTLKHHGPAHGFARYASLIEQGPDGHLRVPGGEEARKTVMDLRFDPHASATMAGELASDHAAYLRGRVGRDPTGGELYAAHFLGPAGSARLIEANGTNPRASAAALFPEAAAANHGVFYHNGQPLSVAEVYANLGKTGGLDLAASQRFAKLENDPGQSAFAAYAGAGRNERQRETELLMGFLLKGDAGGGSQSPAGSLFTSELLTILSEAKHDKR